MLYQITDGTVSVGGQTILSHINFEVKGKEKIAIVGRNGAGKTTLLRLLAGELELDRDDKSPACGIHMAGKITIGMLRQNAICPKQLTVQEFLLEHATADVDRYSKEYFLREAELDRMLMGLGFSAEDKDRRLGEFSGGEQTKLSLLLLLLQKPDLLLLDEPTNHLDLSSVEWLEDCLQKYEGAVVVVSHDRFFLDRIARVVYEIQNAKLTRYAGNYTEYRIQKRKLLEQQKKRYDSQQAEIARLNELIEKFKHKPRKAAFARSRKTILERMEKIECPVEDDVHIFTGDIEPQMLGSKWVLEAEHLKIGYEKTIAELSLRIRRGQKVGIIGDNGAGKTTFLKTVAGFLAPIEGECVLGNHTVIGYFDQQTAALESPLTVLEHFKGLFPAMTDKEVRQTLGAYLFQGADICKQISDLSGGEKSRLLLCELMTSRPNLFILDEPTNHMDIQAKETLESAFRAYKGTILFATHYRYFLNQVADAILVFSGSSVLYYPFGYEHYLWKLHQSQTGDVAAMIRAEDQALVADLKAVPKAERHRLKEIGTEEAYADWRLRLAAEPLCSKKEQVGALFAAYQQAKLRYEEELLRCWPDCMNEQTAQRGTRVPGDGKAAVLDRKSESTVEELFMEFERANNKLTEECLQWYDLFCELYPEQRIEQAGMSQ